MFCPTPGLKLKSNGYGRGLMTGQGYGPIGIPIGLKQFSGFGAILLTSDMLGSGRTYVFTFESGEWFFLGSTTTIKEGLAERMANFGEVVSVSRGLFSDRYVVIVVATTDATLADWLSAFDVSWRDMGYDHITFVTAEGGAVSTRPGGVEEFFPEVGEAAVGVVTGALKPIVPYALGFLAIYLIITILPTMMAKRRVR